MDSAPPMPTARSGLAVATVNGDIYAIGGLNGTSPLSVNEEFMPDLDSWVTRAPMPTPRSGCAVAVYNGEIYVIGGSFGNGFVGNNEVYNPQTNTWETKASMPSPRADLTANIVNGKFYLIGGKVFSNTSPYFSETNVNEVYDPATDTWSTVASIPNGVYGYGSAVIGDKIYVVGGSENPNLQGGNVFVDSVQIYDTQTGNWTIDSVMPSTEIYGVAVATQGYMAPSQLFYIGGCFSTSFSDKVQVYNAYNSSWSMGAPMPTARAYLGVAILNDVIYAIGGFNGSFVLNTVEIYTPIGYGKAPPQIQITSPQNITYTSVNLAFTVNKEVSWIGYSLDNQANVTLNGEIQLLGLSQGGHRVVIFGNDSLGNMGSSNIVYFDYDTTPPNMTIIVPKNETYGANDIQLSFYVDKTANWTAYSLDGQGNITIVGNVTLPA